MKIQTDDMMLWHIQQENLSESFPCSFPQIPPLFSAYVMISRCLFLLQKGIGIVMFIALFGSAIFLFVLDKTLPLFLEMTALLSPFLYIASTLLRFIPRLFWRCPCCKIRFPYYSPAYYSDVLREKECLHTMSFLHIEFYRPKFCSLFVPSICPNCKKKFYEPKKVVSQ